MLGPTELTSMMLLPVLTFLVTVGIAVYVITLLARLVRAVERIADNKRK